VRRGGISLLKIKIRIVLEGLRGEDSIAELCRNFSAAPPIVYGVCQFRRREYA